MKRPNGSLLWPLLSCLPLLTGCLNEDSLGNGLNEPTGNFGAGGTQEPGGEPVGGSTPGQEERKQKQNAGGGGGHDPSQIPQAGEGGSTALGGQAGLVGGTGQTGGVGGRPASGGNAGSGAASEDGGTKVAGGTAAIGGGAGAGGSVAIGGSAGAGGLIGGGGGAGAGGQSGLCREGDSRSQWCGFSGEGTQSQSCVQGAWTEYGACSEPQAKALALGDTHSCALLEDGEARCWGSNSFGESSPPEGATFRQLIASGHTTCGLRQNGSAECWGEFPGPLFGGQELQEIQMAGSLHSDCKYGLTSDGRLVQTFIYASDDQDIAIPSDLRFQTFQASTGWICGIDQEGAAHCWAPPGLYGAVSAGTFQPSGSKFVEAAAGCARHQDGTVTCLDGSDPFAGKARKLIHYESSSGSSRACVLSELDGTPSCTQLNPKFPVGTDFVDLKFGQYHACAVNNTGAVHCEEHFPTFSTPVPVGERFIHLEAGSNSVCGQRADGTLACWGAIASFATPIDVFRTFSVEDSIACGLRLDGTAVCWGESEYLLDQRVANSYSYHFSSIDVGPTDACGILVDPDWSGMLACWGVLRYGNAPTFSMDASFKPYQTVSVGTAYTICAKGVDEIVRCRDAGDNSRYQLGDAGEISSFVVGANAACGLTPQGEARCTAGYLNLVPPLEKKFFQLAMDRLACGLTTDHHILCWGNRDTYAQAEVVSPNQYSQVVMGEKFACGLSPEGSVTCWGFNDFGQARPRRTNTRLTPD